MPGALVFQMAAIVLTGLAGLAAQRPQEPIVPPVITVPAGSAPDGQPAQLIFLLLTPVHDDGAHLELLADIATVFKGEEIRSRISQVASFTEFLALVRSG